MTYSNQQIIRPPALFNTIVTNEIFWLYYLEQLVILHSSNLNTIHHNFSVIATLFQLLHSLIENNSICEHVHGSDDNIMYKIIFIIYSLSTYLKTVTQGYVALFPQKFFSSPLFPLVRCSSNHWHLALYLFWICTSQKVISQKVFVVLLSSLRVYAAIF